MEKIREMKLTIEDNDRKVEITCSADSDIFHLMNEIRGLLIAWGYHPQSILDGCSYLLAEYEDGKEA